MRGSSCGIVTQLQRLLHPVFAARTAGIDLGAAVAEAARATAAKALRDPETALEIAVFDRTGALVARTDFRPAHG
jgi:cobalt-precorrin-5B (C1)-methyltransferase